MSVPSMRHVVAAAALLSFTASEAAAYQLGGLFGSRSSSDEENACDTVGESAGRSILGGILGSAGRSLGIPTFVPVETFSGVLATEIACRLDPQEQEKAAAATEEVTRSGEIGDTAEWTSDTRDGVSGRSTVVARNERGGGRSCLDVTDVIIVEGEETTVTKQMCRGPGESRYTLVA